MELESARAELRVRSVYEAADLGTLLLRALIGDALVGWLWFVLPLQLLVVVLCVPFGFEWAFLPLWWLKPAYGRVYGLVLGRGLFGVAPRGRALWSALVRDGRRGLLADLTWRRFHPARGLIAPVALLEGLSGAAAARRRRVLVGGDPTSAGFIQFGWFAIEAACVAGLFVGAMMILPDQAQWIFEDTFSTGWSRFVNGLLLVAFIAANTVVEPLYTASGFGLYINRRTQLEGWDVELVFRRMARRLAALARVASMVVLLVWAVGLSPTRPACAQHEEVPWSVGEGVAVSPSDAGVPGAPPDAPGSVGAASEDRRRPFPPPADEKAVRRARTAMERVLARPELQREHREDRWELRDPPELDDDSESDSVPLEALATLANAIAGAFELMLWLAVGTLVGFLLYLLIKSERRRTAVGGQAPQAELSPRIELAPPPRSPESPSQCLAAAVDALQAGDHVRVLALLYAGTLCALVRDDGLSLPDEATEGECVERVRRAAIAPARAQLFYEITAQWQWAAYAHGRPSVEQVHTLCDRFAACFVEGA